MDRANTSAPKAFRLFYSLCGEQNKIKSFAYGFISGQLHALGSMFICGDNAIIVIPNTRIGINAYSYSLDFLKCVFALKISERKKIPSAGSGLFDVHVIII